MFYFGVCWNRYTERSQTPCPVGRVGSTPTTPTMRDFERHFCGEKRIDPYVLTVPHTGRRASSRLFEYKAYPSNLIHSPVVSDRAVWHAFIPLDEDTMAEYRLHVRDNISEALA